MNILGIVFGAIALLKALSYLASWRLLQELEAVASVVLPALTILIFIDFCMFAWYFSRQNQTTDAKFIVLGVQLCTAVSLFLLALIQAGTYIFTL
jgi:hypothetical protein